MQFRLISLLLVVTVASVAFALTAPKPDKTPLLLKQKQFDSIVLADAVNYYIGIGEKQALIELQALARDDFDFSNGFAVNERIGWVCRVLYKSNDGNPLRPPAFGGLSLPRSSMPLANWPIYPAAKTGSTYVVLSEGYSLAGKAEPVSSYLGYCQSNGTFIKQRIKVPNRQTAISDSLNLRKSARWTSIKWSDSGTGFSYTMSEQWTWDKIISQSESIPK
ncbi:MAG: hypothetical protein ACKVHR_20050 [Pirellulales bacterium]